MSGEENKKPATLDDVVLILQKNQEILEDMASWVKIGNFENIKKILETTLKEPEEKLVYHFSDDKTTREVNAICGVSIGTVSKYWNAWYKVGIMKKVGVKRGDRFIKKFNLEDFGIDIPAVPPKKEQENTSSVVQEQTDTSGEAT